MCKVCTNKKRACRCDKYGPVLGAAASSEQECLLCSTHLMGNGGDGSYEQAVLALMAIVCSSATEFATSVLSIIQSMAHEWELMGKWAGGFRA